jgi:gliding motility-associated-like protein
LKKALLIVLFVFSVLIIIDGNAYSQSLPAITYATPQVYTVGSPITPLSPTNPGGTVFPASYNTPTTFTAYNTPYSIAIDGSDNVYTTNNSTGYLTKFNPSGTVLFTTNTGDIQGSEVGVDGLGNIYVSQFTANAVLKYNPAGKLLAVITGFSDPYGIAFDASNNVYIANYFSGNIVKIDTGAKTSIYLTGLNKPYGIIIDNSGNMYVGEQAAGDVVKFAARTLAKTILATGFNNPRHLSKDRFGNIYVADYGNNAIKGITPAGVVTTILSTGLSSPRQAAFNSSGSLFVANYGTNTLLKSIPTNYFKSFSINALLPAGLNFNTSTGQITGTPTALSPLTTYTITAAYTSGTTSSGPLAVSVKLPNNAALSNLLLSSGSLSPAFSGGTMSYTASVTNDITNIAITPTASDPAAAITVNGKKVVSGSASTSLPLNVGNNTITTVVTAQDGTTKQSYTVTINRAALSKAALASLSLSSGSLSPIFSSGTVNYIANVANNVNSIILTPTTIDPTATVSVNGSTVTSGTALPAQPLDIGGNTIIITASTQGGAITQSYSLTIFRAGSSSAVLTGLSLSSGNLTPSFSGSIGSYTAKVPYNITNITVTPITIDSTTTITVNDTTIVASGTASDNIPLNLGDNTITTTVTAQDGITTETYTVIVNRSLSTNAALASLSLSSGNLSPVFNSKTGNYTASVPNSISSVVITPTTSDTTATVMVNGITVLSGTTSTIQPLNVGNNTITTVVTAQDGISTQSYTITIKRAPSSTATLSNIALSIGNLATQFLSATTSYSVNVPNSVTNFTVSPAITDPTATVAINGILLTNSNISASFALKVGSNIITTVVTAQDKITKNTYVLTVIRAPSSNAGLAGLSLSAGSLSPAFATATTSYTVNAANTPASVTITPTTSDPTATITVNGTTLVSGTASPAIALKVGSNTITTVITAQDKITRKTYITSIIRAPSSNAGLAGLGLSTGTLGPVFATGITNYTVNVAYTATSITIKPTTSDPTATVTVNGVTLASGIASAPIALKAGSNNIITTIVTAQDKITKNIYTTTVMRAPSTNAGLANLSLSTGGLNPAFAMGTVYYAVNVANSTASVTITPTTSDPAATVTVNGTARISGTASAPIALTVGNNLITTVVTAQDKITTKTYITSVTRAPSSNAGLAGLSLSTGSLSPVFSTGTTNYTASIANVSGITVTPITSDPTATVTINGTVVVSGAASVSMPLIVGSNMIIAVVTAQNRTTKQSYAITITMAAPGLIGGLIGGFSSIDPNIQNEVSDKIIVHQAVSPNGDGINDFLFIEGIENYPDNKVTIFNNSGITIYDAKGYNNSTKVFDGHSNINGRMQTPGTYFYSIEYIQNGKAERKTGYLILKFN